MSEQEPEPEEDEGGGPSDLAPMLPRRRPGRRAGPSAPPLPGRLLAGLLLHLLLPAAVLLLALAPAAATIYLGFLCHSRVHPAPSPACRALLTDRAAAALMVLGFLSLPPLLVLASAARARLARCLRPLLPPPIWPRGPGRRPASSDAEREDRHPEGEEQLCAWV